jgi:hypothetical protein
MERLEPHVGLIDMRAQAELPGARTTDTPPFANRRS